MQTLNTVPKAEFDAFKRQVAEMAAITRASESWCNEGFQRAMDRLGLPVLTVQMVPIRRPGQTSTYPFWVHVVADTPEEALATISPEHIQYSLPNVDAPYVLPVGVRVLEKAVRVADRPCGRGPDCDVCYTPAGSRVWVWEDGTETGFEE